MKFHSHKLQIFFLSGPSSKLNALNVIYVIMSSHKDLALGLAIGCVVGAVVSYMARPSPPKFGAFPSVISAKQVPLPPGLGFSIGEHIGLASTGEGGFSLAQVKTDKPHLDPAHVSLFDEVITVVAGECHCTVGGGGAPLVAAAGQSLLMPKGFTYTITTPGPAEYLAICFPAFSPALKKDV